MPHVYVAGSAFADPPDQPQWIAPVLSDVFVGTGLVFARDQHAARRSTDGRWDRIWGTYQWNPQRYYARPLMCQTDPDSRVAAVLMSRPEDCYAVDLRLRHPEPRGSFQGPEPAVPVAVR